VLTTLPNETAATDLARQLVEMRLAACVGVIPGVRTFYRWQGQLEESAEVQLIIKTPTNRSSALIEHLRQNHPYQLPEILTIDIASGLPDYISWVIDETRKTQETPS